MEGGRSKNRKTMRVEGKGDPRAIQRNGQTHGGRTAVRKAELHAGGTEVEGMAESCGLYVGHQSR